MLNGVIIPTPPQWFGFGYWFCILTHFLAHSEWIFFSNTAYCQMYFGEGNFIYRLHNYFPLPNLKLKKRDDLG